MCGPGIFMELETSDTLKMVNVNLTLLIIMLDKEVRFKVSFEVWVWGASATTLIPFCDTESSIIADKANIIFRSDQTIKPTCYPNPRSKCSSAPISKIKFLILSIKVKLKT